MIIIYLDDYHLNDYHFWWYQKWWLLLSNSNSSNDYPLSWWLSFKWLSFLMIIISPSSSFKWCTSKRHDADAAWSHLNDHLNDEDGEMTIIRNDNHLNDNHQDKG